MAAAVEGDMGHGGCSSVVEEEEQEGFTTLRSQVEVLMLSCVTSRIKKQIEANPNFVKMKASLKRKSIGANVANPLNKKAAEILFCCAVYETQPSPMTMIQSGTKRPRSPQDRSPSIDSSSSDSPDDTIDAATMTKTRKLRSSIWKEFEPIYEGNLLVQAKYNHCLEIFSANRENGRSSCRRHMNTCKERNTMNQMVGNMASLSPDARALQNWKFDQEVSRNAMVNFIVLQELPYSLVEHEPFRKFIATLNPLLTIVSRTTAAEDVIRSFEQRKLAIREVIKNSDSRKWIITFSLVASPHDGVTLFNSLLKSLQDWHLENRLFSITLDNAKNNKKMVDLLKINLSERLLLLGNEDLMHMCCGCHVLNLVLHDGFKFFNVETDHIRESVKYIRSSQARKQRFEEIVVQVGITSEKRPSLDVPTSWNSTYLMLKSTLEYRTAFAALHSQDPGYINPFYDATNVISGSLYPTANHYFHVLWTVKEKLEKEVSNKNQSVSDMVVKMKEKFQKYWDISLLQICVPVVLDPRFKFSFVAFRLNAGFGDKGPIYSAKVKVAVKNLFSAYSSEAPVTFSSSQPRENDETLDEDDPWADWEEHLIAKTRTMKSELDVYLEDDLFPRRKDFDVLQWWMIQSAKYPVLSRMARDVFAALVSNVPSESTFSTSGRVLGDYRSRLTSKNVEALICLQDGLRAEGSFFNHTCSMLVGVCRQDH
ncbi:hypothetical protein U9M48_043419 [Paspalum notatum var. saurae]|uniref:Transposase n=1 Tax=Paspalum notatum var. saurae TaxID=547442 RepID=A0AAQ3XIK7_PASNO